MTSTSMGPKIGGYRREVDYQKLGPALLIASSLILAIRTEKWPLTHSDGLSTVDLDKEVEHSARIAKIVLSHLTARYAEFFKRRTCLGLLRLTKMFQSSVPATCGEWCCNA